MVDGLSRRALGTLVLSVLVAAIPHASHLPLWFSLIGILILQWSYQVALGNWVQPPTGIKLLLLVMVAAAVLLGYTPPVGLEPMTALLIAGLLLKLMELRKLRDAVLLHYLAYLVAALQGLYDFSLLSALYILLSVLLTSASLIILQRRGLVMPLQRAMLSAAKLLLHALPLALVLFLIMPRMGALWSVPVPKHQARTGVSDSMAPGDFTQLGRSAEVAFRVRFAGTIPAPSERYWRGLVLSDFDGRRWRLHSPWRQQRAYRQAWLAAVAPSSPAWHYVVMLEPTQQPWLYTLGLALPEAADVLGGRDYTLRYPHAIFQRMRYRINSYRDYGYDRGGLSDSVRRQNLLLPDELNPKTEKLVASWQVQGLGPRQLIREALFLFNREFSYTLQPPGLGQHSVDEFLFRTKAGFCEHYASAFVVMMRMAGIPARVVVGYQGGEYHDNHDYLVVRQYDAHAWAEVWLEGEGWRRVDPTAAVAPERVERGMLETLAEDQALLAGSLFSLPLHGGWLGAVGREWDALNFHWQSFVLSYQGQQQAQFLSRLLGGAESWRGAVVLLVTLLAVGASLWLGQQWWRRPQQSAHVRAYRRLLGTLRRRGLQVRRGDSPQQLRRNLQTHKGYGPLVDLLQEFETCCYLPLDAKERQMRLGRWCKALNRQLRHLA